MRLLLIAWFTPLTVFWGWLGLARYDVWPQSIFFSRLLYDHVFATYERLTTLTEPQIIMLLLRFTFLDSLVILGIFAWRRREAIKAWWRRKRGHTVVAEA
jgi:hypothetical protein